MADLFGSDQLPSGTKILWEEVRHSRTFSLGFFFPSGSRSDPPQRAGLAHLVEHLVFKGTRQHSASALARLVDRVGGDLNAWTDRDEMAFTCTVPAEHWLTAVEALVELCVHPTFPEHEFDREKEVIRNEILSSLEDPEELAYEEFLRGLDAGAWTRPVAGTVESLARLTRDDALAWHRTHLAPRGRLTVVAAGRVPVDELRAELVSRLGMPQPSAPLTAPPEFHPQRRIALVPADFQMVQVLAGWHFAPPTTVREATLWQVFSMLWGETMSSRLFQALREQKGLCYSVSSQVFDAAGAWGVHFFATGAPENGRPLVEALRAEVLRLVQDPPDAAEWDDARLALCGGLILGGERAEHRVGRLWRLDQSFGVLEDHDTALAALEQPILDHERRWLLEQLRREAPSLLVWGRTRKRSLAALEALWRF